ncbi:MAG: TolC family protein [Deltaproteobacteria bacterium]|nr:TolC family protein [Deltaproteobacteria bacterium]
MRFILKIVILSILISGCSSKQEKIVPVDLPKDWSYETKISDLPVTYSLLDMIEHKKIRTLINEALKNNYDMKATFLRLKAASFLVDGSRSAFLPSANAGLSRSRNNQNFDSVTGKRETKYQYRGTLNINWEIDIWGKLSDEYNAEKAEFRVLKEEYIAAKDSLAARVIQAFIDVVGTKKAIEIQKERLSNLKRNDITLVRRYKRGLGRLDELSASRSKKAVARAVLSSKLESHKKALRSLEILLGRYPGNYFISDNNYPEIKSPPVTVPATVIKNRPDIKAAIAKIESGNLKALAAKKGFLPTLQISSDMLKDSFKAGKLDTATLVWSVVASIIQPIFSGGNIYYTKKARELQRDASVQDLAQKVLTAIKEVQDALGGEAELIEQYKNLKLATIEATKSRIYFENRYRNGLDTIQTLLIAQEEEMDLKNQLNDVYSLLLRNRVELALTTGIGIDKEMENL